jgi:serine/threonine protein phosphatase 1
MIKQWVIPDIHGCAKTLKQLIEFQIQPEKTDELYFLGDYIDRGPDSKGVIDYLISLKKQGYKTRFLKGNHESYFLKALKHNSPKKKKLFLSKKNKFKKRWYAHGGKKCMKSFGVKKLGDIPQKYVKWIKKLEHYIVLPQHILVHAGLNFNHDDPFEDKHDMVWTRSFEIDPLKIDHKVLIHGHVPVSIDSIQRSVKNKETLSIDLDNGVYKKRRSEYGKLVALELNSKTLLIQDNLDL